MSASHNPGGPKEDWGIKFNYSSGEPAPERITDAIYKYTQNIKELKTADLPDIDLAKVGNNKFGSFEVSVQRWSTALILQHQFALLSGDRSICCITYFATRKQDFGREKLWQLQLDMWRFTIEAGM